MMNKQPVSWQDCLGPLCDALPGGVLLTTKAGEKCNTMVIGWGTIGVNWGLPCFVAYVRESRFTRELLEQNPEFTVNIPAGKLAPKVLSVCGSKSGRELDKIAVCGLTPVQSEHVSVPGLAEAPLTLECKVLYQQLEEPARLPERIRTRFYPADDGGSTDAHFAFYAQIVGAYRIEP